MIDRGWRCGASDALAEPRISKWDRDDNFLGETSYTGTTDAFIMDQDGLLYTIARTGGGTSSTMTLSQRDPNFEDPDSDPPLDSWRFPERRYA